MIDRLVARASEEASRLTESVAAAFAFGGVCVVQDDAGDRTVFQEGFACDGCGRRFARPIAPLFSFNSPLGACEACQGFGRVAGIDPERVVPDPDKSLAEGAVAPIRDARWCEVAGAAARRGGGAGRTDGLALPRARPRGPAVGVRGLRAARFPGTNGFFARLERKRYKVQNRVLLARYRRYDPCPDLRLPRDCARRRAACSSTVARSTR